MTDRQDTAPPAGGRDRPEEPETVFDEEALLAEYEAEKPARHLTGRPLLLVQVLGAGLSLFALWWVYKPPSTHI